jgi:hypothetical protein
LRRRSLLLVGLPQRGQFEDVAINRRRDWRRIDCHRIACVPAKRASASQKSYNLGGGILADCVKDRQMVEKEEAGPFYINYTRAGEHYMVGPYSSRRFALKHIEDVRRMPGVTNVYLGLRSPSDEAKAYRHLVPVTTILTMLSVAGFALLRIHCAISPDWLGWLTTPGTL